MQSSRPPKPMPKRKAAVLARARRMPLVLAKSVPEHHRFLDLPLGHGPVAPQEALLLALAHEREAATLVEADGPRGRLPRSDQHRNTTQRGEELPEERAADAAPLRGAARIGVADEHDIGHRLRSHDAEQAPAFVEAEERDAGRDLARELFLGHVRLVPAVGGNHAAIRRRAIVDDLEHVAEVRTRLDHFLPRGRDSPLSRPRWRLEGAPSAPPGAITISAACEARFPIVTRNPFRKP